MLAVEVRQGTLRLDGRRLCSAGPAGNTGHGGSRLRADSTTTKEKKEEEEEEVEEEEEEKADIKSNHPHLTGGEKYVLTDAEANIIKYPLNCGKSTAEVSLRMKIIVHTQASPTSP